MYQSIIFLYRYNIFSETLFIFFAYVLLKLPLRSTYKQSENLISWISTYIYVRVYRVYKDVYKVCALLYFGNDSKLWKIAKCVFSYFKRLLI